MTIENGRKGFTLIELIAVMSIIGTFLLFAAPNYLQQMERARVATIQNEVMRAEGILKEKNILAPETFAHWVERDSMVLQPYLIEEDLYDRDGHATAIADGRIAIVPHETAQDDLFSELGGTFVINRKTEAVYYVDTPDIQTPKP